jgi:hypothetical protein
MTVFTDALQTTVLDDQARRRVVTAGRQVRWGCVAAYTVLATHPAALEELVRRMAAGRPVAECLVALEAAHAAAGPGGPRQD